MKIIVLGAAAGGGFPQWNAASTNNAKAFAGDPDCPRQTQASLAVSANGEDWLLLNASPDIREQIVATPELHPKTAPRSSPIKAVVLTGADIDAITGLLTLRERQPFSLWATSYVHNVLAANPVFDVLDRGTVNFETMPDKSFTPVEGLTCRTFATPGKPPLYLERIEGIGPADGASVGLSITDTRGKTLAFVPSCAEITDDIRASVDGADALFFDGTMYTDDEMLRTGEGKKTARRMGHVAMTGKDGAIEGLREVKARTRYFIHINNSNPVLNRASPERKAVEAQGWRIAEDGMRIDL
ncbi:MAG: pyrroloquinoline quinone biosynthesis protein PqqB [Alphaproteobacteria bacterium]|nr:pyrroloquinoline quinone biosynthesis protein PqqB [Alphaproteobacteria bacterium]